MLFSAAFRDAFDLSLENDSVRDRFGRHAWGQRAILARRLVEAGARFVTIVMENPYVSGIKMPKYGTYNWDSHAVNCHLFDEAKISFHSSRKKKKTSNKKFGYHSRDLS